MKHCVVNRCELGAVTLETYKSFSPLFEHDIYEAITLETVVNRRTTRGGTGTSAVQAQLAIAEQRHRDLASWIEKHRAVVASE